MAQVTELQAYALPGRVHSFSAKTQASSGITHPEDTWKTTRRTNGWISNGREMAWKSEQNPVAAISDR